MEVPWGWEGPFGHYNSDTLVTVLPRGTRWPAWQGVCICKSRPPCPVSPQGGSWSSLAGHHEVTITMILMVISDDPYGYWATPMFTTSVWSSLNYCHHQQCYYPDTNAKAVSWELSYFDPHIIIWWSSCHDMMVIMSIYIWGSPFDNVLPRRCLEKDPEKRATVQQLLSHPYLRQIHNNPRFGELRIWWFEDLVIWGSEELFSDRFTLSCCPCQSAVCASLPRSFDQIPPCLTHNTLLDCYIITLLHCCQSAVCASPLRCFDQISPCYIVTLLD